MGMKKLHFLRETTSEYDNEHTSLYEYLKIIFPNIDDWIHDKIIPNWRIDNKVVRYRPDYRSETLKMIVEFDGLQHFQNPIEMRKDDLKNELYGGLGYRVVRIPYFIQLTNQVVKQLFGVDVSEDLFDSNIASLGLKWENTPAFLTNEGIKRMALVYRQFPQQYEINKQALEQIDDDFVSGLSLLEFEMAKLNTSMNTLH